jgi:predicted nucleic acid-binding protein
MPRIFVDTNVLIYVRDMRDLRKRKIAQDWIGALTDREIVVVNLQVLNELANWMLKRGQAVEAPRIRASVEALREWGAEPLERADVELAWDVRQQHGFQWFDCLHVASAHRLGCTHLLSEDMSDGATFRRVRIVNPFTNRIEAILGSD